MRPVKLVTWNVNVVDHSLAACARVPHPTSTGCALPAGNKSYGRGISDRGGLPPPVIAVCTNRRGNGRAWPILLRDTVEMEEPVFELAGVAAPAEARWIEASVRGVRVCTVYVPNGRVVGSPHFAEKLSFFDAMIARVRELAARGANCDSG